FIGVANPGASKPHIQRRGSAGDAGDRSSRNLAADAQGADRGPAAPRHDIAVCFSDDELIEDFRGPRGSWSRSQGLTANIAHLPAPALTGAIAGDRRWRLTL